jgi:N-acetylglucosamine malate deacetylase 2
MESQRHVLAVYPHPDDESFGKAGTIALFTRSGTPVTLICATLGQMGRNMGKPFFATRETLPAVREQELRNACDVLGIRDLRLLGLRDKTIEFEDPEFVADKIEAVLREVRPSLVITYYPRLGVHPDHDALSAATIRAVKRLPKEERPVVWGSPVINNPTDVIGQPDVEIDVSSVLDVKIAAIKAHRSQSQAMMSQMEAKMKEDPVFREETERRLSTERYWIYPVED